MGVLQNVKDFFLLHEADITLLASGELTSDFLSQQAGSYAIVPIPGERVVERYINGGGSCEFPFAFQSTERTDDEDGRIAAHAFYEALALLLDQFSETGVLPTLGAKQDPFELRATGWGYLFSQGESGTGVYQIQCKLAYEQQP